jgi:uncharacterized DUF497 family protein
MKLLMSQKIREKLRDAHGVSEKEVEQCFLNREGPFLRDLRAKNLTSPTTQWFIADTNKGRALKVCFIFRPDSKTFELKTAYEPNANEREHYEDRRDQKD